jgi:DNA-binding SARP family transcriptional activator
VLALEQGHLVPQDRLIELLWPDLSPEAATNSLHVAVSRLRRLLASSQCDETLGASLIRRDTAGYSLTVDPTITVDSHEFRRLVDQGRDAKRRGARTEAIAAYRAALARYRGALCEDDPDAEWAVGPRQLARDLQLALREELADCLIQQGNYAEAVDICERGVADDPTREGLYAQLLRAHEGAGHLAEGLRAYERCRQALVDELGVDPGPTVRAIHQRLLEAEGAQLLAPSLMPPNEPETSTPYSTSGRAPLAISGREGTKSRRLPHLLPCVGRDDELARLLNQLDQSWRGDGRLVLIQGEPGIGKSRLLDELARLAAGRGTRVLAARAYEMESDLPYAPVVEALSGFLRTKVDPAEVVPALGQWGPQLASLIPTLRDLVPDLPHHQAFRADAERAALIAGLTHLLLSLARARPLVLQLDDLQWADTSTLQWLHHLARRLPGEPVLVVGAYRTGEIDTGHPLHRLRSSLAGDRAEPWLLDLGCLNVDQVVALFPEVSGSTARGRELAARLHRETDGHPLFLVETLRTLQETGVLSLDAQKGWVEQDNSLPSSPSAGATEAESQESRLPIPSTLAEAILWRTRRLNETERRLLAVAGVCNRGFTAELLSRCTGMLLDAALDGLEVLAARQFVRPARAGRGFDFRHDLIQDVVYRDLGADRRRVLHGRIAETLEGLTEGSPRFLREVAGELAHHYRQGERWAEAFEYSLLAGDHARDAFAPAEALIHYRRAAALASVRTGLLDAAKRARLLERLGRACADVGELVEAAGHFDELGELARSRGDHQLEGRALVALADAHFFRHDFARAEEKVAAALSLSEALDDSRLRVGAQATAASIAMAQGRTDEAERHCDAVLALTGWQPSLAGEEDPVVAGARLGTLGWVGLLRTMQGDSQQAMPAIEASLGLGQELHNPFLTGRSRFALAMSLGNQGRYSDALSTLREALRLAEEAGDRYFLPRLLNTVGWVYSDLGDLRQAEEWNRRSIAVARETGWLEAEANARVNLGTDALRRDDRDAAREELAQAAELVDRDGWFTWRYRLRLIVGLGELSLLDGNLDQAGAFARAALTQAEATTSRKHAGRAWLLLSRVVLATGGSPEEALRHVEQAYGLARATGNPPLLWASGVELARLRREADAEALQEELRASVESVVGSVQDAALRSSLSQSPLVQAISAGAWASRPRPGTIIPR